MSFRLFIYYCAAWGAAAAFFGWMAGRILGGGASLSGAGLKGMALGLLLALGLGLLDILAAGSRPDTANLSLRLTLSGVIGAVGGFLGGFLGQALASLAGGELSVLRIIGWTVTGALIGAAPYLFDYVGAVMRNEQRLGIQRKLRNGMIGGAAGGFIGGVAALIAAGIWSSVFKEADPLSLWAPSASAFVGLGACIGLGVSLAQILLREAALRVETGFRPGRQLLLTKPQTVIGRAEACDLGLFGDEGVESVHAKLVREGNTWTLSDANTPSGTLLNGQPLTAPTALRAGDRIQIGGNVLSFDLKSKESAAPPPVPPLPPAS